MVKMFKFSPLSIWRNKKMEATSRKKVFATSWHPGGAHAILPVIKKLAEDGSVDVVVLGHEFSEPIFSEAGIAFQTIKDFGLTDISEESMEKLLKKVSPDLVLTGTGSQEGKKNDIIEQTTMCAARKLGIASLAVLDYWANYSRRFTDERTGKKLDVLPNKIAVMDETAKLDMLKEGFPESLLVITGNPHFDNLVEKAESFTEAQKQEIRRSIGFSSGTLFFLACNVFSQWKTINGYWDLDVVKLVSRALSALPAQTNTDVDIKVVVRLHPRMPEKDKQEIIEFLGRAVKIKVDQDANPNRSQVLAMSADLTIVEDSTLGIEAVLMKRPCISLQPGLLIEDSLIVSKKRIVPVGYKEKDCLNLLSRAVDPGFRAQIVKKYAGFSTDGKATERVASLVYSLLEGGR
jgi:hypothetical protein